LPEELFFYGSIRMDGLPRIRKILSAFPGLDKMPGKNRDPAPENPIGRNQPNNPFTKSTTERKKSLIKFHSDRKKPSSTPASSSLLLIVFDKSAS